MMANRPGSQSRVLAGYTGGVPGKSGQAATSKIAGKPIPNVLRSASAMRLQRLSTSLLSAASEMGRVSWSA